MNLRKAMPPRARDFRRIGGQHPAGLATLGLPNARFIPARSPMISWERVFRHRPCEATGIDFDTPARDGRTGDGGC